MVWPTEKVKRAVLLIELEDGEGTVSIMGEDLIMKTTIVETVGDMEVIEVLAKLKTEYDSNDGEEDMNSKRRKAT
ncbi:hypothetical protein JCGZ_01879 [Jatropha curcas]|uniref:Uncharacterized protein n=1 Tax=Jatropha curcas TaxID=180498 RepID=A0A067L0U7_JATCU|nr:hypothetical protein JCGZ_01879 [Jatropha curcas]